MTSLCQNRPAEVENDINMPELVFFYLYFPDCFRHKICSGKELFKLINFITFDCEVSNRYMNGKIDKQ